MKGKQQGKHWGHGLTVMTEKKAASKGEHFKVEDDRFPRARAKQNVVRARSRGKVRFVETQSTAPRSILESEMFLRGWTLALSTEYHCALCTLPAMES
jgi:hypothetical protein